VTCLATCAQIPLSPERERLCEQTLTRVKHATEVTPQTDLYFINKALFSKESYSSDDLLTLHCAWSLDRGQLDVSVHRCTHRLDVCLTRIWPADLCLSAANMTRLIAAQHMFVVIDRSCSVCILLDTDDHALFVSCLTLAGLVR